MMNTDLTVILTSTSQIALVDNLDKDLVNKKWGITRGYVRGWWKGKNAWMHRIVASRMVGRELNIKEQVDHINGNKLDNRRINLRLVDQSTNLFNLPNPSKRSTTGIRGVYVDKRRPTRPWRTEIQLDKKRICLGSYPTIEEAQAVYSAAQKMALNGANESDIRQFRAQFRVNK